MSEISQLLREGPADSALAFRAADEIDRLEAEIAELRKSPGLSAQIIHSLREQLAHTEADFEACNEISCRRWEEIQRLREQLVRAHQLLRDARRFIDHDPTAPRKDTLMHQIYNLTALTDEQGKL